MFGSSVPFARLEDRLLMTAEPTVTVDVPPTVELGNTFQATISFDNTDAADVGYGPYIDLILPTTGADGAGAGIDDGISFVSATYLGSPVIAQQVTFDTAGNAIHPYAVDSAGNPIIVSGTPGDTLVVLTLPFGSFTPAQTPADIIVNLSISNLADLDQNLTIEALGGFRYGGDPLNNPTFDAPIRGILATDMVMPTVIDLEKVYIGPEDETATGPNYIRQYQLRVDIATGQTVGNIVLTDFLPPEIQLTNVQITQGSGTITLPSGGFTTPSGAPGNELSVNLGSITGVAGDDAVVTITYFVPYRDATAATVLTPGAGADIDVINTARVTGEFTPVDPRDQIVTVFDDITTLTDGTTEQHTLEASPLVIQKGAAIVVDNNIGGLSPRDVIEYTLQIQLSDFFTVGDIVISDLLSDGQRFDASFVPVLIVNERGTNSNGAFSAANFTVTLSADNDVATPATPGTTDLQFLLSNQLVTRGLDGILVGGDALNPGGLAEFGATTATIVYRAIVQDNFTDTYIGRPDVGQGDQISNTVRVDATVRDNANPNVVTDTTTDDSGVTLEIVRGEIAKTIYAVNGSTSFASNEIQAGDTVTFRLTYTQPLSKFEDFEIRDFLPLPVFSSAQVVTFISGAPSATAPAAGQASFGPSDTFNALSGIIPTITRDNGSNQLNFIFGDFAAAVPQARTIDILFTVTVVDSDFVDGLFLTNQATGVEANTATSAVQSNAIVNFIYAQPELEITKGVVSSSTSSAFFGATTGTPANPGPSGVTFAAPGFGGAAFTGNITSDALDTTAIDANLRGIDAGDLVKFAIVVENTGGADNGAFDIRIKDTLPPGFTIATGGAGLNLRVTDGTGAAIAFTPIGGGLFDPNGGIELTDPASDQGALQAFNGTNGRNLVVITYDLVAVQTVQPSEALVNTATLTNFAAFNGGIDRTAVDLTDDARVLVSPATVDKVVVATSHIGAGATAGSNATIGEEITYLITITLPEGTINNAVLTDLTPAGNPGTLEILSARIITIGANLTNTAGLIVGSTATPTDGPDVGTVPDSATFNFGNIINTADNVANANDQITIEVRARVVNDAVTAAGDVLTNRANFSYTGGSGTAEANVTVVEPNLVIDKQAPAGPFDANDTVPYTIVLSNTGANTSTAYDVVIADLLADLDLDLIPGTVTVSSLSYGTRTVTTGNGGSDTTVSVAISELRVGDAITITFNGRLSANVVPTDTVPNTATADFSSLPPTHPGGDANERDYTRQDSASVPISAVQIDKVLVSTNHTGPGATAGANVTIGELITYDITVTIPEGVVTNAILSDLALGTNPGTLQIVSAEIIALGSRLTNTAGLVVGATVTPTDGTDADTIADSASFSFGTITNSADNVTNVGDQITIRVTARAFDESGTSRGDILVNRGAFSFTNAGGTTTTVTDDVSVTVVEPTLLIDKVAPAGPVDAGDGVNYTITISHGTASNATAYDVAISDLLADLNLDLVPGTVTITNLAYGTRTATTGNTAGDSTVAVSISELRVGDTITVAFQARPSNGTPAGVTLLNTASVAYDTLPEGTLPGTNAVDRNSGASDSATVPTRIPALSKTVVATSIPETGTGEFVGGNVDLNVGELVTYEIRIEVPEGTSPLTLIDQLPTITGQGGQISWVSAQVVSIGGNISANALTPSITTIDSDADGFQDRTTFAFGSVTNTPDGVRNGGDFITVRVVGLVQNAPANAVGDTLVAPVTLNYGQPTLLNASASVDIVNPVLDIQKTVSNPAPGTVDAGDVVTYTLVIDHTTASTSTAFDLVITDLINDPALRLVSGTVTTSSGTVTTGNGAGNTTIRIDVDKLDRGIGPITITYQATITNAAVFGSTAPNIANLEWDSNPDEGPGVVERTGTDSDDARVAFPRPTFDKSVAFTSVSQTGSGEHDATLEDLVIGEDVTFNLVITLPEGTSTINLVDNLPGLANGKLGYVSSTVVTLGGATGSGLLAVGASGTASDSNADGILDRVSFNFGTVTNVGDNNASNNQIIVRVTARVLDLPINADADLLTNSATLTYSDGTATPQTLTDTASVEIVEPVLVITKTASSEAFNPGEIVTYTLVVNHTVGSTANAFDVVLSDLLSDPNVQFVPGSVTVNGAAAGSTVTALAGDGFQVNIAEITQSETVTITYQATVLATAPRASDFDNTANLNWDSRPGDGDPTTPADNGRQGTTSASDRIFTPPLLDKSVFSSSNPSTGLTQFNPSLTDLTIGETVTYRLTVTLPETTNRNLFVTDVAPAGLELLTARVVSSGMTITAPAITLSGGLVTFNFGTVINPFDGSTGADDVIVLEVTGRVLDVAGNVDGSVLRNTTNLAVTIGTDQSGTGGPNEERNFTTTDFVDVEVVEPLLTIDKSRDIPRGDAGTIITYTLVVRHDTAAPGVSHANAHDVVIEDLINDPDLQLVAGSVTTTSGTITQLSGDGFRVNVAEIPLGDTVTITYRALILNSAVIGDALDNTATIAWDSNPGPGGRTGSAQDAESVIVDRAPIEFTKTVFDTSLARTGSRIFDPSIPDIELGELVTYRLTVTLAEGTDNITIVDRLPSVNGVLELVSARVVSVGSNITLGSATVITSADNALGDGRLDTVTFRFGPLVNAFDNVVTDADRIVVEIVARAPAVGANSNGDRLTNTAVLTSVDGTFSASADVELLVPQSRDRDTVRAVSGLVDDARFAPLVSLNPFFSGTAEYGSYVTVTLRDASGSVVGTQGGFADAGGNWAANFPLSTSEIENDLERDRDLYFVTSRLFSDSHGIIGRSSESLAQAHWANREVYVGARLLDQPYTVEVHQELASYNAGLDGAFNVRAYFTPVITNEVFGQERQIDVQKVFEDRAEFSLDQLYAAALAPLGLGSNRFTNEFLAIAGSAAGR